MQETVSSISKVLDVTKIRKDFPILHQQVNGKPLVYLDNAATTQKPATVINAIRDYYSGYNANIHRGIHTLAEKATTAFEDTRTSLANFINAREREEVIFTYGTTDAINLVASTWGRQNINEGDEIVISTMEHHSNIVPWQMLCEEKGAVLKVIPVLDNGELDWEAGKKLVTDRTKLVSLVYVSNALGTINPVNEVIDHAHGVGAKVMLDAAQASCHINLDVQQLKCDFLALSAHKVFGPTGVGILYGTRRELEKMPPFRGGGEMIKEVTFEKTTYAEIPYKFEAGTPNIADVVAFKSGIEYVQEIGLANIALHEEELLAYAQSSLQEIDEIRLVGTAKNKASVVSFTVDGLHHFDVGMMLDAKGIAVRTGHHCTQPLMHRFGIEGTIRASFVAYNFKDEVDIFVNALKDIIAKWK